ncbi:MULTISPECIES: S66 peptidase family protein [Pseudomonas]|uniref:LD-carboxypeptidase n=1 Tax=Pseudomonas juntendi TaxID=2666183 RepID=A0A7W2LPI7_9PSED|nr:MULTISPECIES: LD-carboxypeptidase [Pseudomonas]NOY01989.1 LD-carboxypeptidase [Gammaproteobacteria bacterium]OAK60033.1 LD-carboxypeptidase [Pseudomonas putida]PPB13806.1 LD-carboxypeptidase [Pseudomonas aeruginosa]MBA6144606.1 LD-carboxypeptidase [Pseudomonas juntendi]MCL8332062.1 LD-carboxypeptidase [Pseudomonas juntendi]
MNCVDSVHLHLPKATPQDACFAIIAPAGAARLDPGKVSRWFAERGYRCRIFPGALQAQGYLAGPDQQRLQDLHDAFADPDIDAILCMRGGYGSMRLLDQLDFQLIRHNPKPLIGYSDITALHTALYRHAGLITFHGGMLNADLLGGKLAPTESSLLAQLGGRVRAGEQIAHPAGYAMSTVLPGVASGRLLGGNLSMLGATLGTVAELDTEGCILFIEDVNEPLYRVDRLLTQLRLAGKLVGVKGVLVGDFAGITTAALTPLLEETFGPLGVPVLAGWRSGHCDPNVCLPLGARVRLDSVQQSLVLEQDVFKA